MTKIESKRVLVQQPIASVRAFLNDLTNLDQLLPMEKLSKFEAGEKRCRFFVQGTLKIELELQPSDNEDHIIYQTSSTSAFPFTLNIFLEPKSERETEVYELCEAKLNPFLKVMIEGQLEKLFDYIADRLPQALN